MDDVDDITITDSEFDQLYLEVYNQDNLATIDKLVKFYVLNKDTVADDRAWTIPSTNGMICL